MKNFRIFFAFAIFAVASSMMVACSEKDDLTPEPQPPTPTAITFDIEVTDVTATSANLWVTPSSDDVLYFFDMITNLF